MWLTAENDVSKVTFEIDNEHIEDLFGNIDDQCQIKLEWKFCSIINSEIYYSFWITFCHNDQGEHSWPISMLDDVDIYVNGKKTTIKDTFQKVLVKKKLTREDDEFKKTYDEVKNIIDHNSIIFESSLNESINYFNQINSQFKEINVIFNKYDVCNDFVDLLMDSKIDEIIDQDIDPHEENSIPYLIELKKLHFDDRGERVIEEVTEFKESDEIKVMHKYLTKLTRHRNQLIYKYFRKSAHWRNMINTMYEQVSDWICEYNYEIPLIREDINDAFEFTYQCYLDYWNGCGYLINVDKNDNKNVTGWKLYDSVDKLLFYGYLKKKYKIY